MGNRQISMDDALVLLAQQQIDQFNQWRQQNSVSKETLVIPGDFCQHFNMFDFSGCNLSGANCRGLKLSAEDGKFLVKACQVDFSYSDLSDAYCKGVDFSGSDFTGTKLNGTDCRCCNFDRCKISAEQLKSCKISDAKLTRINFRDGFSSQRQDLRGVDFSESIFGDYSSLENCDLRGAMFFGTYLKASAKFDGARFSGNIEDLGLSLHQMDGLNLLNKSILPLPWLTLLMEYRKMTLRFPKK